MSATPYTIQQGDCVHSIAAAAGLEWKTVWQHPENEALRKQRKDPNQLLPGDVLAVPEKELKELDAATEKRHTYRVKNGLIELRIVLRELGRPRKAEPYHLELGSPARTMKGTTEKTDDKGTAIVRVPASLREAVLVVGKSKDRYQLLIGHMDPADTPTGRHARLENTGYDCGGIQSPWDEVSERAMNEFHREHDLPEPDQREKNSDHERLKETYGS